MAASQQIPIEGIDRLTLDLSGADVAVEWVDDTDEIVVMGPELPVEQAAGEVFIRADLEKVSDDSKVSLSIPKRVPRCTVELEQGKLDLTNPQGSVECQVQQGDLRLDGGDAEVNIAAGSGDAHVTNLHGSLFMMGGSGNLTVADCETVTNVRAGSGEIRLDRVNGEAIRVASGSGDITISGCLATAFSSESGSGDVRIQDGRLDRITVRTGSGDTTCRTVFGPHSQTFASGSGTISVGIPRDLPARIEATTSRGDIESDIPLVSVGQRGPRSRKTRRQVGSIGAGEPRAEVSIRTSSGDVRLHWLNASAASVVQQAASEPASPTPTHGAESDTAVQMEILSALSRGEISVEEADSLLRRAGADQS